MFVIMMITLPLVAVESAARDHRPPQPRHRESVQGLGQRGDLATVAPRPDYLHGTTEGLDHGTTEELDHET